MCVCVCVHAPLVTSNSLWPHQASLSAEFSRQEYWSRLLLPSPGDLSDPGIKPTSLSHPALAGRLFTSCLYHKWDLVKLKSFCKANHPQNEKTINWTEKRLNLFLVVVQSLNWVHLLVTPASRLFASGSQSTGASAAASVLPVDNSGLISFWIDWFDLLAVQGNLFSGIPNHQYQ